MDWAAKNKRVIFVALGIVVIFIFILFALVLRPSSNQTPITTESDGFFPSGDSQSIPITNLPALQELLSVSLNSESATSSQIGVNYSLAGSRFKKLVAEPVVSAAWLIGSDDAVVYLDQASGNLYQVSLLNGGRDRLSFTTYNGPSDVIWGGNINEPRAIIKHSLGGPTFSAARLVVSSSTDSLWEFLANEVPDNSYAFTSSPNGQSLFYLTKSTSTVLGVKSDWQFNNQEQFIKLVFGDWQINWLSDNLISFQTKPSALVSGSLYLLDLKIKKFNKILGGINGLLSKVSPNGQMAIYSGVESGKTIVKILDLKTKDSSLLPFSTLADKCAWSHSSENIYCAVPNNFSDQQYPDRWFKGLTSFNDDFWKIDAASGTAKIIADTAKTNAFDADKLFTDNNDETLFFINKKDLSLWSFDIRESF